MDEIRNKLEELVMVSLADIFEELGVTIKVVPDSRIYGDGSSLDSMAVVSMIVDLETRLDEELDFVVSISDERAMSQKRSPFRDVPSMVEYLLLLYKES